MPRRVTAALLVCLCTLTAGAQSLRVRVLTPQPGALAATFEAAGLDVMCGHEPGAVLCVLTPDEKTELEAAGFTVQVLSTGQPFSTLQAALPEGVPGGYPDLAQVYTEMAAAEAAFPSICKVVNLTQTFGTPQTFEGRDVMAVKISDNVAVDEDEPAMLVASCHHAREIITPVIALHAIDQLTTLYGSDPDITAVVDGNELWIIPVVNVDGYEYVFTTNNNWRKNRRVFTEAVGVDPNRNYPLGWSAPCSGSSNPSSGTYKGPSPASEPEIQTIMALTAAYRFAKVVDFHSFGEEVLWAYNCLTHPFSGFFLAEAIELSTACGYGGDERPPSAEGEHQEWHLGRGAHAFLVETGASFQPSFNDAQSEAAQVFPGILWLAQRPLSVHGHVTDPQGASLDAAVEIVGTTFDNGEEWTSGGPFGRYAMVLPPGSWTLRFTAPGYAAQTHVVSVTESTDHLLDVILQPVTPANGQANSAAAALDVAGAVDGSGFPPSLGVNGPFIAMLAGDAALEMTFSGPPNEAVVLLMGPLNEGNAQISGVGSLDLGANGPLSFADIDIVLDGVQPESWIDGLANTGPNGSQTLSFTLPSLPPGLLGAFQALVDQGGGLPVLTAAVEVVIL